MERGKLSLTGFVGAIVGGGVGYWLLSTYGCLAGMFIGFFVGAGLSYYRNMSSLPAIPGEHLDRRNIHLMEGVDDEMIQSPPAKGNPFK